MRVYRCISGSRTGEPFSYCDFERETATATERLTYRVTDGRYYASYTWRHPDNALHDVCTVQGMVGTLGEALGWLDGQRGTR